MLRQRRNLSAFKQHQKNITSVLDEIVISDFSDSENEENRSTCDIKSKTLDADCTVFNISNKRTKKRRNSSCTPSAKRIKRIQLTNFLKPLKLEYTQSLNISANPLRCLNFSTGNAIQNEHNHQDEEDFQEATIEWSSSSDESDVTRNTSINNKTQSIQQTQPALLERTQSPAQTKQNLFKRCRKGGYLQQLQQTLDISKADRKFLEHDKKFGIRQFVSLRVLSVEDSFGVHSAEVITPCNEVHHIVLDANMAKSVRIGNTLECLAEDMESYEVECCDAIKQVFVEPSKFTLC